MAKKTSKKSKSKKTGEKVWGEREEFAIVAMRALMEAGETTDANELAEDAWAQADAMLAARNKAAEAEAAPAE